jgi:hypothetical protein
LADRFADFGHAAHALARQLSIFDPSLCERIESLFDYKLTRLRFWLKVLGEASVTIATMKSLAKIDKILSGTSSDLWPPYEQELKPIAESFSLNDESAVRAAVADGYRKTEELQSLVDSLAQFIKTHCEFVDLFPDVEPRW